MPQCLSESKISHGGKDYVVRLMTNESYTPNLQNTNKGTPRGDNAVRSSLRETGWGRGALVASNGEIVAGNHSVCSAEEEGIVSAWIEVETDGEVGVITKRTDWDSAQVPQAVKAAILDNRTNELNFLPDIEEMQAAIESLQNTDYEIQALYYTDGELEQMLNPPDLPIFDGGEPEDIDMTAGAVDGDRYIVSAVLTWKEHQEWEEWREQNGYRNDKSAILGMIHGK